ncbi:hypothetical protein ACFO5R_11620 [Halosolutus amylolyticus]|uniref:DUF4352 domain-containing protein n=1 Tax=Halosolutus amylolyticus TaxID=2932267 RepID=A0ABD5PPR2_9EURY|nr:hypothetical protein [Halosolutus amylolyticus]
MTSIETAEGSSALVGLEAAEEPSIDGRQDEETVGWVTNNMANEAAITADIVLPEGVAISDGSDVGPSFVLGPDEEPAALVFECDGGGSSGTDATVTVTIEEADTGSVRVEGASFSTQLDYTCTGSGGSEPVSGELEQTSDPQVDNENVTFDVENNGTDRFRVTQFAVDHGASTEITEITIDGDTETPDGGQWLTDGTDIDVSSGQSGLTSIDPGETVTVALKFDVEMNGETFEITFTDTQSNPDKTATISVTA